MRYFADHVRTIECKGHNALDEAKIWYAKYSPIPFEDDLIDYMKHGFVCVRPNLFGMVKVCNIAPENSNSVEMAWYIRIVIGDLWELCKTLPGFLPHMVFCRNNEEEGTIFRIYKTERIFRLARSLAGQAAPPVKEESH